MDLISAAYGWTDAQILDCTLARLTQIVAAIQRRQWLDDLTHRRIETAKLRTMCAYIAATMQLAEGADNVMLAEAANLSLGAGTEPTDAPTAGAGTTTPQPRTRPAGRARLAELPDAPTPIRPGKHTTLPGGLRLMPAGQAAAMFGGGLL